MVNEQAMNNRPRMCAQYKQREKEREKERNTVDIQSYLTNVNVIANIVITSEPKIRKFMLQIEPCERER